MVSIGQNLAFRAAQLNSTTKKVQTEEENNTETTATTNETAANTQESNAKTLMPKSDVLLANIGVKINKPGTEENPNIELQSNFQFDSYNEFVNYRKKVGFREGDLVTIFIGKDDNGNEIYDAYVIGKDGSMDPVMKANSMFNYDNQEDFDKALKAGVFKPGDNIVVDIGNTSYCYVVDENNKLVLDSFHEASSGK